MSALASGDADGSPSPYNKGRYNVQDVSPTVRIKQSQRSLWIVVPKVEGKFPVVQFQHGYGMKNTYYGQIISHIASYGFIVVAPQMDRITGFDATKETDDASDVLRWIEASLKSTLSTKFPNIRPDLSKLALVGHSRGGKVVFAMGTMGKKGTIPKVSAIIGLDPVDGNKRDSQTEPRVLTLQKSPLNLEVPTLIVGTGLGPKAVLFEFACAPEGVNHDQFYSDLTEPVFHFVAKEYGHIDFMDDDFVPTLLGYICPGTDGDRTPMRRFAGGVVAAFLQAIVGNTKGYFDYILKEHKSAPVELEEPEKKGELPHNHNPQVPLKDG